MQQYIQTRTWAQAGERWPLFTFICIVLFTKNIILIIFTAFYLCQSHMADMYSSKIQFKYVFVRFTHLLLQRIKMQIISAVSLTKWRDDKEGDHMHKSTAALQRTLSKRQIFPMYQLPSAFVQTCGPVRCAWESFIYYRCKLNWQGDKMQVAVLPSTSLVCNSVIYCAQYAVSPTSIQNWMSDD